MIRFEHVNKWFGDYQALVDINETIRQGEVVVVCGPSGSGKSTLIRTINRLEPIQSGRILLDGEDIHRRGLNLNEFRSRIGFVFQQFNLFPHLTALQNCTLAPMRLRGLRPAAAERSPYPCWSGSGWRTRPTPTLPSCPAASNSGWPSPAPWPCNPR